MHEVYSDFYCGKVGCKVATRRFKKHYPAEYKEMVDNMNPKIELLVALANEMADKAPN